MKNIILILIIIGSLCVSASANAGCLGALASIKSKVGSNFFKKKIDPVLKTFIVNVPGFKLSDIELVSGGGVDLTEAYYVFPLSSGVQIKKYNYKDTKTYYLGAAAGLSIINGYAYLDFGQDGFGDEYKMLAVTKSTYEKYEKALLAKRHVHLFKILNRVDISVLQESSVDMSLFVENYSGYNINEFRVKKDVKLKTTNGKVLVYGPYDLGVEYDGSISISDQFGDIVAFLDSVVG